MPIGIEIPLSVLPMITGEEVNAQFFQPVHWLFYMLALFAVMVGVSQWQWSRACDNNIQVLVAEKGGGGRFVLAPKVGGQVTIKNPSTDAARTWPLNELATIDVPYPGLGFIPKFLQKSIRLCIVNEGDWEPMLNRSPHRENIASPDIVEFMMEIAVATTDERIKGEITKRMKLVNTGPTREMIADPAILGNLEQNSIMRALATVSNDLMDILRSVNQKLTRVGGLNPMVVYIGLGLSVILVVFLAYNVISMAGQFGDLVDDLASIKQALGVK